MTILHPSRRSFLLGTLGGGAAIGCGSLRPLSPAEEPSDAGQPLVLRCLPARVFKALDPGSEDTESWHLKLLLENPSDGPWG